MIKNTYSSKKYTKVLAYTSGFSRNNVFKNNINKYFKSLAFNFVSRKLKKRFFRKYFILKINKYLNLFKIPYSTFIFYLKKCQILLNRKVLYYFILFDFLNL